ncbi:hypothetical protein NC652_041443 [Populus alba x Populus x berolinensis]|nr:hypothetical protein NC652_041443 [Populus alba x Populus x berolinensis]
MLTRLVDVGYKEGSEKPSDHVTDILKDAGAVSCMWRASVVENKGSGYWNCTLLAAGILSTSHFFETVIVITFGSKNFIAWSVFDDSPAEESPMCVLHIQYPERPDHGVSTNTNGVREILRRAYHTPPSLGPGNLLDLHNI